MVPDFGQTINWCLDILPPKTRKAFLILSKQTWLRYSKWYLAGGTALALQAGHRSSVDLDFFLPQADFRIAYLLKHFEGLDWRAKVAKEGTIYGELLGAKVSFIAYPFFAPQEKPLWHGKIRVLNKIDIAVMKVVAISQRGRKRDFFDLYWCVKNLMPLAQILEKLDKSYPTVVHNYHHILKSLTYFADAELDPTPKIFFKASWREVKNFFKKETPRIARKLLNLN